MAEEEDPTKNVTKFVFIYQKESSQFNCKTLSLAVNQSVFTCQREESNLRENAMRLVFLQLERWNAYIVTI